MKLFYFAVIDSFLGQLLKDKNKNNKHKAFVIISHKLVYFNYVIDFYKCF